MSRRTVQGVLGVVLAGLVAWLTAFAIQGSAAAPGSTPAEERAQQFGDIRKAAELETLAFLAIDYQRMDELTARVIDGATGEFKEQYETSLESLKQSAISQESISDGSVGEIGLSEVDSDSATVFVAASSKVQNKGTDGQAEDRSWRIKLSMVNEDGRWLVSQLEFVG